MKKNLFLIVRDECGHDYCKEAYTIPCVEELTRDEVEAFKSVLLSRVDVEEEAMAYYWDESFTCKTDREAEDEAWQVRYEELLEECDGDEDEALEMLTDEQRESYWGCDIF